MARERYAFEYETPSGDRREYSTVGEGLTADEAAERALTVIPAGSTLVKTLRGDIPDGFELPTRTAGSDDEASHGGDDADSDPDEGNSSNDSTESGKTTSKTSEPQGTSDESDADDERTWDEWSEDEWLDEGYKLRLADVEAGLVDDHLDAIIECETSQNVIDAVTERQLEIQQ